MSKYDFTKPLIDTSDITTKFLEDISSRREHIKEEFAKAWLATNVEDKNLNADFLINNIKLVEIRSDGWAKVSWYFELKDPEKEAEIESLKKELEEARGKCPACAGYGGDSEDGYCKYCGGSRFVTAKQLRKELDQLGRDKASNDRDYLELRKETNRMTMELERAREIAKERLGPAGYKIIEEVTQLRADCERLTRELKAEKSDLDTYRSTARQFKDEADRLRKELEEARKNLAQVKVDPIYAPTPKDPWQEK
jgi:hypothetical protein